MKRNLLCWICGIFLFTACNDDDSPIPNEAVTKAFQTKYPAAEQVEWEHKGAYLKAEFIDNQLSHSAWFDANGQWHMTETELNRLELLPEAVRKAFGNSEYADWTTDDIDRLDRQQAETLYVIEVKKDKQEFDLYYSQDGILMKAVPDTDQDDYEQYLPGPIPSAVTEWIDSRYPGARIIEVENEHGLIEADIIYNNKSMEVVFNSSYEWIDTHYDVTTGEVEETVLQALNTAYGDYLIDDIEKYETPEGNYYVFELEKGATEIDIKIDLEGNIQKWQK